MGLGRTNKVQFENTGYAQTRESSKFTHLFFLFLMFPVTVLYHICAIKLFKEQRQKPHLVMSVAVVVSAIVVLATYFLETYKPETFVDTNSLTELDSIVNNLLALIAYLFIGVLWPLGFILVIPVTGLRIWAALRFIRQNEAYTHIPTVWCYDWNFVRTPLEKAQLNKNIKKIKEGKAWQAGQSSLGISVENNDFFNENFQSRDKIVYRLHKDAKEHTMVVGGTGAGKSFSVLGLAQNSIENGFPTCFVDFKRGDDIAVTLAAIAKENGANFYHFLDSTPEDYNIPDSEGVATYDPFANAGNAIPDMLVNMREYDEGSDHYKQKVKEFTSILFRMLRESNPKYFLDEDGTDIIPMHRGEIIKWEKAIENIDVLHWAYAETRKDKGLEPDENMRRKMGEINKPGRELNVAMNTVSGSLFNLTNSPYGEYLDMGNRGKYRNINMFEGFKPSNNDVFLFSFSADSQKVFSESFGALIMQDLSNISARRREQGIKNDVHIYVDEFQAVPATTITSLVEKARGSGFAATFISQSLAQIEASSKNGRSILTSIINTCSNFFVFNGSDKVAAELLANILGEEEDLKASLHSPANRRTIFESIVEIVEDYDSDNVNTSKESKWILSPEVIQSLKRPRDGQPPEMIAINKASPFDNGKHYIKLRSYVSNKIGELAELADSIHALPPAKEHEGLEIVLSEGTDGNVYSDNSEHLVDTARNSDFSLEDDGDYSIDYDVEHDDVSSANNANTENMDTEFTLSELEEIKNERKKKKSFDLEQEMRENFSPGASEKKKRPQKRNGSSRSTRKKPSDDITQKRKNIMNKFD